MSDKAQSSENKKANQPGSNRLEENRESVLRQKKTSEEMKPQSDRGSSGANSNADQNQNTGNRSSNG